MSKRTLLHALHVIMLSNQPQQAIGFASWLKCQREMEEDEIIMNNKVNGAPGEDPISIAVYDRSENRVDEKSVVLIEPGQSKILLNIKLDERTLGRFHDVQFLVETLPYERGEALQSSFIDASKGGGTMCDGRRAHARGKKGWTMLQANANDCPFAVKAGYASYHGAVTLTPVVQIRLRDGRAEEL
mmetsp:Transcript_4306/g.9556  ORF Transcript_4306/g.9556 Transcript_4306/m.9556 type:complete len:186 (-) Transcript_4306:365-922(-)